LPFGDWPQRDRNYCVNLVINSAYRLITMTCSLGYYDVNYCEINISNPYIALSRLHNGYYFY